MKKLLFVILAVVCFIYPVSASDRPTLTVLDFKTNNVSENDMNSIITFLSASLFDTEKYRVIDTAQRDTILQELAFSNSGCTDESCQLEIGQLLSAEIIVTGDIANIGNRIIITARMIETETSETLSTSKSVYKNLEELIDSMHIFAEQLAGIRQESTEMQIAETVEPIIDEPEEPKEPLTGRDIAAWSTLGAGAVAAGVGGYFIYNALAYKSSDVEPALAVYNDDDVADFGELTPEEYYDAAWADYLEVFDVYKGKALTGLIITGAGILSIGASVVLFLLPDKQEADVSFMILPQPDACSFQWRVRM